MALERARPHDTHWLHHHTGTLTDLRDALRKRLEKDGHWGAAAAELDGVMVGAVMPLTSQCVAEALPSGQLKPFPDNRTPPR